MDFTGYLRDLATVRAQAEATAEPSLREPLLRVVRALAAEAQRQALPIAQEANAEQAGQPDVFVKDDPQELLRGRCARQLRSKPHRCA